MRIRSKALALIASMVCLIGATPAMAASDFNLTTSPLPIDLVTKPGKPITAPLRVQNSGSQPMTLKVSIDKFKASGATGSPQISKCGPADDFCKWVSFSKTSFLAQPGQWYTINMTISPPADSGFGYYYAVIFSNANPGKAENARSNVLTGATATMVLLDVQKPGEKRQLSLNSFVSSKKLYEYLPADFSVSVRDIGNIHLIPSGSIYIKRGGSTLAVLDVNPNGGNVLPDSSRTFTTSWSDGFPHWQTKISNGQIVDDKRGQPVRQLDWSLSGNNKLRFGHYTAHLILTYNDGSRDIPLQGDVSFWVIPWKIGIVLILILLLIGFGFWSMARGTYRKLGKKNRKSEQ